MSFVSKNFSNAAFTLLSGDVDDSQTSLPIEAPTGWPAPAYTVTIDRGYPSQEVCLVQGAPTGFLDPVVRNYDGNGAYPHAANAVVEISATAQDWKNFNLHNMDTTRDDHPSLMMDDGTRHDLIDRHYMGTSLPGGMPSDSHVDDIYDSGSAPYLAHADHVHGRSDDPWSTYTDAMLRPGMVFPVKSSANDPRLIPCDGGWYNQYQYPRLYAEIGNTFPPVSGIANPGTGAGTYNPTLHFAVPLLGQYVGGLMTWNYLNTKWAIMADAPG
jgi:hypothetical protein